ncbi:MAG: hypothetical protein O3C40_05810 [Planctomycetota bacterium]|nr:hypothetical protein [Planctomycetota bacterium]
MRIGIDLDNTIVCYDGLFHQVAVRRGLIPTDLATDKQAVRDYLRADGRNDDWTELQGLVYGEAMNEAQPYSGVAEFIVAALRNDWTVFVISHRTRQPYLGPPHDLHAAARAWLASNVMLPEANVFLEVSLEDKLQRIAEQHCDLFVDDLPELLLHPGFPAEVERVCFDPANRCIETDLQRVTAWSELTARWFGGEIS